MQRHSHTRTQATPIGEGYAKDEHYQRLPGCDWPAICVACARRDIPTLPVTPAQLMRPGIGQTYTSCPLGDCQTSRPEGRSQPRELWFSSMLAYTLPPPPPPPIQQLCFTFNQLTHSTHCPHTHCKPSPSLHPPPSCLSLSEGRPGLPGLWRKSSPPALHSSPAPSAPAGHS